MYLLRAFFRSIIQPVFNEVRISVDKCLSFKIYVKNLRDFNSLALDSFPMGAPYPCLLDRRAQAGEASGHYFHQDLTVAQRIFESKTSNHLDVGSRIDGFVAHVASFMKIDVLDIRPMKTTAKNITFHQWDLMSNELGEIQTYDSVSCLHALEHFGLGRYGDSINPDGWIEGLEALTAITRPGGTLYLSVPIGPERIEFDAHRVFSLSRLRSKLDSDFVFLDFIYVDDFGNHHEPELSAFFEDTTNFGCSYGCGIFVLRRK
jgi:hypothetical protein